MEFRQLRQFIVLAELLNFRRTAERLNMAQPPLSVSIRKLEDELEVTLFQRDKRGVQLTTHGEALLPRAKQIIFQVEQFKISASQTRAGEIGILRVGFVASAAYVFLLHIIPAFRERYPDVSIVLDESISGTLLSKVEDGMLDVAIVRVPLLNRPDLKLETIKNDRLVAALPPGSPLAMKPDLRLIDLKDEPFIINSRETGPNLRALVMLACQRAGFIPQVVQESPQISTILYLVESGLGVALVPSVTQRSGQSPVTLRSLDHDEGLHVGLALAYREHQANPVTDNFRALATQSVNRGLRDDML